MWSVEEALVISDLHLAAEHGRGLFQADEQLVMFLRDVRESFHHCHLFLNGDVFDFLVGQQQQMQISLDNAAAYAATVVENHREVFKELSLLANSKEHEIIILGGNHDPEMALPTVQKEIERHLNSSCAHSPVRWLTNGEAALFQMGDVKVLIEHGDQYDAWNWIDHEALRRVVCLASRNVSYQDVYKSPPGSRLVINRFNLIRDQFPWLQTLQPLSAAIIPLALEVILPTVSDDERFQFIKAVKEVKGYGLRSVVDSVLLNLGARREYWANEDEERQLLSEWLAQYEREENVWGSRRDAKAWLARAVARLRNIAVKRNLKRVSGKTAFFDISADDENHDAVARLLDKGANLVVHGHTHAAKAYQVGRGLYLNTGTWGQLTKLPDGEASEEEWAVYIEGLRAGRADSFQRPTFVRISKQAEHTTATLFEWTASGAQAQSGWSFADGKWER
jgi:UDP-2,3-diacylglucosamine pyrophosphatase LpxH